MWLDTIIAGISIAISSLTCILGVLVNGSFTIIILINKQLQSQNTNVLMACLSACDLLTNLVAQPLFILLLIDDLTGTVHMDWDTCGSIFTFIAGSSLCILTVLNVDRAVAFVFPLYYKVHFTQRRLLFAVLVTLPVPWLRLAIMSESLTVMRVMCALLLMILLICTVLICISLRKSVSSQNLANATQATRLRLVQKKCTKTVLGLMALQFILYVPSIIFLSPLDSLWMFRPLAATLIFSNSFLNSSLYVVRNNELTRQYARILRTKHSNAVLPRNQ